MQRGKEFNDMERSYALITLNGLFIDGFLSTDIPRSVTVSTLCSLNLCQLVEEYKKTPCFPSVLRCDTQVSHN